MSNLKQAKNIDWDLIETHTNPLRWLEEKANFKAWPYQKEFIQDHNRALRVVRKSRQIGMTTIIGYEVTFIASNYNNELILIVSPSLQQSLFVMDYVYQAIDQAGIRDLLTVDNKTKAVFKTGSTIISCPNNPRTIRGYSPTRLYLEEVAFFMNDAQIRSATSPMKLVTKAKFTLNSTPFGKRGIFHERYNYAAEHPSDRIKTYDYFPSTICPVITEEIMLQMIEEEDLTEIEARQEYYGEFIEETDTYYPQELISKIVNIDLPGEIKSIPGQYECGKLIKGEHYFIGVDFAKQVDETAALFGRKVGNKIVKDYSISWTGMDYEEQIGRLAKIIKDNELNITYICADKTNTPAAAESLARQYPTEGIHFTRPLKVELASGLRRCMENKTLEIPNEKKLMTQLNLIRYEVTRDSNIIIKTPEADKRKTKDDHAIALALLVLAAKKATSEIDVAFVKKSI